MTRFGNPQARGVNRHQKHPMPRVGIRNGKQSLDLRPAVDLRQSFGLFGTGYIPDDLVFRPLENVAVKEAQSSHRRGQAALRVMALAQQIIKILLNLWSGKLIRRSVVMFRELGYVQDVSALR